GTKRAVGIGASVDHDEGKSLLSSASTHGFHRRRRAGRLLRLGCISRRNQSADRENIGYLFQSFHKGQGRITGVTPPSVRNVRGEPDPVIASSQASGVSSCSSVQSRRGLMML